MTNKTFLKPAGKFVLYILLSAAAVSFINGSYGRKATGKQLRTLQGKLPGYTISRGENFHGTLVNDTVPFSFVKKDELNVNRYVISGVFLIDDQSVSFSLNDTLVLNYKKWDVSPGNRIYYSTEGISVTGFLLSNDSASITLTNQQELAGGPVEIVIRNFDIRDLTGFVGRDSLIASGLLNVNILVREFTKAFPLITGTASVSNLTLKQQHVGNVQLNAQMWDENTIHTTVDLSGNSNEITASGNICINDGPLQVDALLNIKKMQLGILQGFTKGMMSLAAGSVNGLIALQGKFARPEWKGSLNFDSTKLTLNQFGSTYSIDKQKVLLDYPAINFNQFILKDTLGHTAVINGNLCSNTLTNYDLDFNIRSRDFTLINAPKAINNQFYGYAGVDADLSIAGNTRGPVIKGNMRLGERTGLTLVLPEKNIDKDAARSVVRFIDRNAFELTKKSAFYPAVEPQINFTPSLRYDLNIQADRHAALTFIIDPTTGDELKVQGDGNLKTGIDTGGNMVITGSYRIDSGYYELNYQFLKKRFYLVKGSTIDFNSDPANARVDIKAEYIANTAPKDLLGNEVGSVDPAIARSFNQNLPFKVILFLKGSLKKPAISFDIQLPADRVVSRELRTTIENKLVQLRTDIALTNKQVFALLVLDRFVGEQSSDFFKGNGGDFSDITKESVSKFLSAALDQLASDLFKGINVDLNLNSFKDFYNSNGTHESDLNVEVSKNFLNDRLSVAVGRNFGIESQDASTKAAQQKASRFLPDVTVNYKLSADGKYMFRSYKKSQLEVILDGYVVESGLAFIVTMDYDMFNEMFYRSNKKTAE